METNQLIKSCSVCGLPRPLSAFLQHSADQVATYGNICADCRGKPPVITDDIEDIHHESPGTVGLKIDANAKVHTEKEKRQSSERGKDADKEERKRKDKTLNEKEEAKESNKKDEINHRKNYLDIKKKPASFLNYKSTTNVAGRTPAALAGTPEATEKVKTAARAAHAGEQIRTKEAIADQEEKMSGNIDFSVPFYDPQFSELRYHSAEFLKFKSWLGASAPIVRTMQQMQKNAEQKIQKNPQQHKNQDKLVEQIENQWEQKPGSKKGR